MTIKNIRLPAYLDNGRTMQAARMRRVLKTNAFVAGWTAIRAHLALEGFEGIEALKGRTKAQCKPHTYRGVLAYLAVEGGIETRGVRFARSLRLV